MNKVCNEALLILTRKGSYNRIVAKLVLVKPFDNEKGKFFISFGLFEMRDSSRFFLELTSCDVRWSRGSTRSTVSDTGKTEKICGFWVVLTAENSHHVAVSNLPGFYRWMASPSLAHHLLLLLRAVKIHSSVTFRRAFLANTKR